MKLPANNKNIVFSSRGTSQWCLQTLLGLLPEGNRTEHPPQLTETGTTDDKNQSILIVFLSITSHLLALW